MPPPPPGLRLETGVGPAGVDEGDNGAAEFFGLLHEPPGLAVALRAWHTKVAAEIFLQVLPLSGADDRNRVAVEHSHASQNGRILSTEPVTPLLKKVCKDGSHIIRHIGPSRMPGNGQVLGRSQFFHSLPPFSCSSRSCTRVSRIWLRGTTASTKPCSS